MNIKQYELVLSSVSKTLQQVGDRLCKSKHITDDVITEYDVLQQRLSDISKTVSDIKVSKYVPNEVYTGLEIELNALHNDIKLFAVNKNK